MLDQYAQNIQNLPALIRSLTPHSPMDPTTTAQSNLEATVPLTPPMDQATPSLPTAEPTPPSLPRDHQWCLRPYPIITPAPNSAPRWQQLIHDPTELDIKSYSGGQDADFHAGTLNIGGSLRERITDISYTFAATGMGTSASRTQGRPREKA
jgi:hypothetical protein